MMSIHPTKKEFHSITFMIFIKTIISEESDTSKINDDTNNKEMKRNQTQFNIHLSMIKED